MEAKEGDMGITRTIPVTEWKDFLPAFSEQNRGRPTRIETMVSPGEGEPVLAECQPLLAVDFDRKGSEAPAIIVTVGGLDPETPNFTHVINDPTQIWVLEEVDGRALGVDIESEDEGRTIVVFEPEEALPERSSAAIDVEASLNR